MAIKGLFISIAGGVTTVMIGTNRGKDLSRVLIIEVFHLDFPAYSVSFSLSVPLLTLNKLGK